MMTVLFSILVMLLSSDVIDSGDAFLKPLQERDSVLIADQFRYGFRLESVAPGTEFAFPDMNFLDSDTLALVQGWTLDTLRSRGKANPDMEAYLTIAPFEPGVYSLPELYALRRTESGIDTLRFAAPEPLEVNTIQIDTATFVIHDIKGQIGYPLTFKEVMPWIAGALALALLIAALVYFIRKAAARKRAGEGRSSDPPHIVALRELDRYRSDKYWAPGHQKAFYSGITDILKNYIDARFGIDAPEMTTVELFDSLKSRSELTPEMYGALKDLFERADFVKFAKYTADDKENAAALPLSVRFVTETYQEEKAEDEL